ncbi:hypothetical protein BIW11_00338, partial [Tropilaelaps mercedesae]
AFHLFSYPARAPVANSTDLKELQQFKTNFQAGRGLTAQEQAVQQLYALGTTLGIALLAGAFTGFILMVPLFDQPEGEDLFDDELHWGVPEVHDNGLTSRPKPLEMPPAQVIKRHAKQLGQEQGTSGSRVAPESVGSTSVQVKF